MQLIQGAIRIQTIIYSLKSRYLLASDIARAVVFAESRADASVYAINTQCTCLFIFKDEKFNSLSYKNSKEKLLLPHSKEASLAPHHTRRKVKVNLVVFKIY